MQKAYNKLDIVVNIAVCTHLNNDFDIGLRKWVNMNHIKVGANCNIDTISSYYSLTLLLM